MDLTPKIVKTQKPEKQSADSSERTEQGSPIQPVDDGTTITKQEALDQTRVKAPREIQTVEIDEDEDDYNERDKLIDPDDLPPDGTFPTTIDPLKLDELPTVVRFFDEDSTLSEFMPKVYELYPFILHAQKKQEEDSNKMDWWVSFIASVNPISYFVSPTGFGAWWDYRSGLAAHYNGNYLAAFQYLTQALAARPGYHKALTLMIRTARKLARFHVLYQCRDINIPTKHNLLALAKACAIELDEQGRLDTDVIYQIAKLYEMMGEYELAIKKYESVITRASNNNLRGRAYLHSGDIRLLKGEFDAAQLQYYRALETGKHRANAHLSIGYLMLIHANSEEALRNALGHFDNAIYYNKRNYLAYLYRAEIYNRLGETHFQQADQAIARVEQHLATIQAKITAYNDEVERLNSLDENEPVGEPLVEPDGEPVDEPAVEPTARHANEYINAHFVRITRLREIHWILSRQIKWVRALRHKANQEYEQAIQLILEMHERFSSPDRNSNAKISNLEHARMLFEMGAIEMLQAQPDYAIKNFSAAITFNNQNAHYYARRARAYVRRSLPGDEVHVMEDCLCALNLEPDNTAFQQAYDVAILNAGRGFNLSNAHADEPTSIDPFAKYKQEYQGLRELLQNIAPGSADENLEIKRVLEEKIERLRALLTPDDDETQVTPTQIERQRLILELAEIQTAIDRMDDNIFLLKNVIQREKVKRAIEAYVVGCLAGKPRVRILATYYRALRDDLISLFNALRLMSDVSILQRSKYSRVDRRLEILETASIVLSFASKVTIGMATPPISADSFELVEDAMIWLQKGHESGVASEAVSVIREHHSSQYTLNSTPYRKEVGDLSGARDNLFLLGFSTADIESFAEQIAFFMLLRYREPIVNVELTEAQARLTAKFTCLRIFLILKCASFVNTSPSDVFKNIFLHMGLKDLSPSQWLSLDDTNIRPDLDEEVIHTQTGLRYYEKGQWKYYHADMSSPPRTNAAEFGYRFSFLGRTEAEYYRFEEAAGAHRPRDARTDSPATTRQVLTNSHDIASIKGEIVRLRGTIKVRSRTGSVEKAEVPSNDTNISLASPTPSVAQLAGQFAVVARTQPANQHQTSPAPKVKANSGASLFGPPPAQPAPAPLVPAPAPPAEPPPAQPPPAHALEAPHEPTSRQPSPRVDPCWGSDDEALDHVGAGW